jgi:trimeric autotransporter adhesin
MRGTKALLTAGALAALVATWAPVAAGKSFEVTRHNDPVPGPCTPNDCSLREAVLAANQNLGEADRIVLPNRRRPYELEQPGTGEDGAMTGDLDLNNDRVRIVHPGRGRATIDANELDRVFELYAEALLQRLVVTGGRNPGAEGGGIRAGADLKLLRSRITGNRNLGSGAGISVNGGLLTLSRSTVSNNQSTDAAGFTGGGIQAIGDADVVIRRSRIVGNQSTGDGGGLYLGAGSARVLDTTIANNQAPFGGGGIHTDASLPVVIRDSTLSDNETSGEGGGIEAFSRVVVTNSTLAGNVAFDDGGGIYGGSDVTLNAVTVTRNVADSNGDSIGTGGGLYYAIAPGFEVENSLIALNRVGDGTRNDCYADPSDPFDSLGHNLLSSLGPSTSCLGFEHPSDRVRANPRIGKLANNGGPTKTIALKAKSAAVDTAKRATAPNRDQRGVKRDRRPDIGAFER